MIQLGLFAGYGDRDRPRESRDLGPWEEDSDKEAAQAEDLEDLEDRARGFTDDTSPAQESL